MRNIFVLIIACYSTSVIAQSDLGGVWNTGEDNTKIEITEVDGQWTGKIKSSDNEKARIGRIILKDLEKEGSNWTGQIYAARRKEWYDVEITPKERVLELEISAGLFNKSLEWKKQQ